jgi:iron-sulfur cluster repair protein YtfE (RIC family)
MTEYLKTPGAPKLFMATQTQTQTQETQAPTVERTVYKRVKIPVGVYEYVRNRARARGLSMWQYIIQSINFYESSLRNVSVSNATKAQNASYYATKLIMAITEFIHRANQENYDNVVRIISQVEKRKGVDLSTLRQLIEMYRQKHRKSLVRTIMQELIRINVELMSKNQ